MADRAPGIPVVSVAGMRDLESRTEAAGVPLDRLMAQAGRAVAAWLDRERRPASGRPELLCLVGPGNNGGDGLVAAAHLARAGWHCDVVTWSRRREPDWPQAMARAAGCHVRAADGPDDRLRAVWSAPSTLVLDALFGIGRGRPFTGPLAALLADLRRDVPPDRIVALDTPSGADSDTGRVDSLTPPAGVTLTLGAAKVGLLRFPAADLVGRLVTLDIGLPANLLDGPAVRLLTDGWVKSLLPPRPLHANKGTFGKAAIVAGCADYPGAAALTSAAAVRAGAGLVMLASTARVGLVAAAHAPEPIHLTLAETTTGAIGDADRQRLLDGVRGCEAVLVGPGLGQAPETGRLVLALLDGLARERQPAVIDADALNTLARQPDWFARIAPGNVLTPHPGEMSRLLGGEASPREVDAGRFTVAPDAARRWGHIVVLKGAHTVVAHPDGRVAVSPTATPALATAGSGDVLAGLIAGLAAQGLTAWDAALAGVFVHARAGELAAAELGVAGCAASDLLPRLPRAQQSIRGG